MNIIIVMCAVVPVIIALIIVLVPLLFLLLLFTAHVKSSTIFSEKLRQTGRSSLNTRYVAIEPMSANRRINRLAK